MMRSLSHLIFILYTVSIYTVSQKNAHTLKRYKLEIIRIDFYEI